MDAFRIEEVYAEDWTALLDPAASVGSWLAADPIRRSKDFFAKFRIREIHISAGELGPALERLLRAEPGPFQSTDVMVLDGNTYGFDLGAESGRHVMWSDSYEGGEAFRAAFGEVIEILRKHGVLTDDERDGVTD
ncbi:MAG TPA: hypothetical protein VG820_06680 [Fimbriimonadaceae bacterium]|nr:hypothetical protein [Fimbriimonadaceae bacterium]